MRGARCGGLALPELLVALLVFSGGILALLHNQFLGARLAQEALQRSLATALARDLVTRIQLNPGRAEAYRVDGPGDIRGEERGPEVDCGSAHCDPDAWSSFESWQWRRLLHGRPVFLEGGDVVDGGDRDGAGLIAPAVCVARTGAVATVAVGWFTREAADPPAAYRCREGDIAALSGTGRPAGLYSVKLHAWVGGAG